MSEPDPARTPTEHSHEHQHGHEHDHGRVLWISLATLGATAVVQAVIVALSGSVALLGDTIHNAPRPTSSSTRS
jgi:Co/Zn/Cd efflux system component